MLTQRIDSTKAPSIQIGPLGFNAALLSSPAFSEPDLSRQRHPEPTMQSSNPLLSEHEYTNKHCSSTMDLLDGTDRSSAPVERYYLDAEAKAAEQTFQLKSELKNVTMAADFWEALTDGMSKVAGAQYAFVSKREIGLEDIRTTESPPTPPGEETEHHLLGLAVHFNDGKGNKRLHRNWMYRACDFMISEKVVLIPTSLDEQYNPGESNSLAFSAPAESYLAVPLRLHNKCIGHMGLLWTKEGIKSRPWLSWPYLEMFLHALEDTVCSQILDRNQYNIRAIRAYQYGPQGCPLSLKPYARRVSHELRTPMQGVVGILDLLNMSVLQIARMDNLLPEMREVIEGMLENIEMAQG